MTIQQKTDIQNLLHKYVEGFTSQSKAAQSLKNVSEAVVIAIRKDKWDSISDSMWRNVGKQIGYNTKTSWNIVETANYKALTGLFDDSKEYSNVFAVTADAGSGKSLTAHEYSKTNANAFHIVCAEYYNKRTFLAKLLESMQKDSDGNVSEMMDRIIEAVLKMEEPIIILDEFDKLNDNVQYFFITLYNMLEDKCGIVLMATDQMAKKINRGVRLKRKGYAEIFSRISRRFLSLKPIEASEIAAICSANGIKDKNTHSLIYNDSEGDLRRVKKAVHRAHKLAAKQVA